MMAKAAGVTNRVNNVADVKPKAKLTTMGRRNYACVDCSIRSGVSPMTMVNTVRRMARKRSAMAVKAASSTGLPASKWLLVNSTSRIAFLTTTPASVARPTKIGRD